MEICEKDKCTGCFACYNICPKHCIEMVENEYGYIYPNVDEKKCIKCNSCKRVCPTLNEVKKISPQNAYAAQLKDLKKLKESASGGVASIFYYQIVSAGGSGYGVETIKNEKAKFIRIDNINQIYNIKGSKYVHAYIKDTFKQIKRDLLNSKKVLFVGTPCQVAGLKNFLNRDYNNLITVDLICHGVPPQKLLKEQLEIHSISNIDEIKFRDGNNYVFEILGDNYVKKEKCEKNIYMDTFFNSIIFRDNCYNCIYAKESRVSDITIGDFWGLGQDSKLYANKELGISLILPMTEKGKQLIEQCTQYINMEERTVEEAIKGNSQLRESVKCSKERETFKNNYLTLGYEKSLKKSLKLLRLKRRLKKIIIIYKKLKK